MKAMILAAGLGTRLKPFTNHHPKALVEINGKSLLQRNIEYLQQFGISDVIVNVHHFAEQIIDAIKKHNGWGANITISDESQEVLETGGGLKKAAPYFKEASNFVLLNADILTDLNLNSLIDKHKVEQNLATLAVSNRSSSRYFLFNETDKLCGWENINTQEQKITKPAKTMTPLAFSGIHIINASLFSLITQEGKFSIVEVYLALSKLYNIGYYNHTGSKFIDVGKPGNIAIAAKMFE